MFAASECGVLANLVANLVLGDSFFLSLASFLYAIVMIIIALSSLSLHYHDYHCIIMIIMNFGLLLPCVAKLVVFLVSISASWFVPC